MKYAVLCFLLLAVDAAEPPADLMSRVAERETANEALRNQYMYRQTVIVEDLDPHGARMGQYREVRDIIFSPDGARTEQPVQKPSDSLKRLKLTAEDLRDIREVQPVLFTRETAFLYENKYRREEDLNGVSCWLVQIRPAYSFTSKPISLALLEAHERGIDVLVVVDDVTVEEGSFNYTVAAESKNAENVLVLHDPGVAQQNGRE